MQGNRGFTRAHTFVCNRSKTQINTAERSKYKVLKKGTAHRFEMVSLLPQKFNAYVKLFG